MKHLLKSLAASITQYWYYWLGGVVVVILLISAILRALTPDTPPVVSSPSFIQTNVNDTHTAFSNITYVGSEPSFPTELPSSRVTPITNESTVINAIIEQYQLSRPNPNRKYWTNGTGQSLIQDPYNHTYQLALTENPDLSKTVQDSSLTLDLLARRATDQITSLFPDLQLYPQSEQAVFLRQDIEFFEEVPFNQAQLITIPFAYEISSYPLRYKKQNVDPFHVIMTGNGEITQISFAPLFIEIEPTTTHRLLSIEQAIININNNQGAVISYGLHESEAEAETNISTIDSAKLTTVSLEYRYDEQVGAAYPFYRFAGNGIDNTSKQLQLEIITPAVATTN